MGQRVCAEGITSHVIFLTLKPGAYFSLPVYQSIEVIHKIDLISLIRSGASAMEKHYTGEKINIAYNTGRCIHVAECVKRLHTVLDTSRRPWVLPDAASQDSIATTVVACPSGALHYVGKDGDSTEPISAHNTIRLVRNGPLYLRGDFTIVNGTGELVVNDTRAALCRCGGSANKPFCDNTHKTNGFVAPETVAEPQSIIETLDGGNLHVETTINGPLHITGSFTVLKSKGEAVYQGTDETFCRCGGLRTSPSVMAPIRRLALSLSNRNTVMKYAQ
jgi:uncharacterized Fe-S cluster protein YjdI/CDGSH-type Zn-finger protein